MSQLLSLCRSRTPCPNGKIVKNLCTLVCSDPNYTPPLLLDDMSNKRLDVDSAILPRQDSNSTNCLTDEIPKCGSTLGILTLQKKQKVSDE